MSLLKRFGRRLAAVSRDRRHRLRRPPAAEPKAASPAMWKVADKDTTIYLFGTIHLLPKDTKWRSPAFDKAAASADTLVVETIDRRSQSGRDHGRAVRSWPSRRACRRSSSGSSRKSARAAGRHSPSRAFPARLSTSWKPGRRRSSCWSCSCKGLASIRLGVESATQEAVHRPRQVDRRAGNQCRAARLLRPHVGGGAAQVPGRRARGFGGDEEAVRRDARAPGAAATSRRSATASTAISAIAPELKEALLVQAQCQLGEMGQGPARPAGHGAGRGRRRPSRRRRFGVSTCWKSRA